jgi:hypothetical protein
MQLVLPDHDRTQRHASHAVDPEKTLPLLRRTDGFQDRLAIQRGANSVRIESPVPDAPRLERRPATRSMGSPFHGGAALKKKMVVQVGRPIHVVFQ